MKDPLEGIMDIVKDKTKSDEERANAAYIYGLLMFSEKIDEDHMRITKETAKKLGVFVKFLRLIEERKK